MPGIVCPMRDEVTTPLRPCMGGVTTENRSAHLLHNIAAHTVQRVARSSSGNTDDVMRGKTVLCTAQHSDCLTCFHSSFTHHFQLRISLS